MASNNDRFKAMNRDSQTYSDFLPNLYPHPVSKDIVKYINENSVVRSIRNLLMTDRFERLYQPNIGTNLRKMLFEPISDATSEAIASFIKETITKSEPRAKIISVNVAPDDERHRYLVTLTVLIINTQDPISFNITLDRIR